MATYMDSQRAYGNDVDKMIEEMPLHQRLEGTYSRLTQIAGMLEELQHGPQPEKGNLSGPPISGVLNLASECDKVTMAIENQVMIIVKRIGRL